MPPSPPDSQSQTAYRYGIPRTPLLVAILIGALVGFALAVSGVPTLWLAILAIVALMFGPHLYLHAWLPYRLHAHLRRMVDPSAGPPKGAEPVEDGFPDRLMDAVRSGTHALEDWLADDFVMIDARGRRHDARRYLATQRAMQKVYPDLTEHVEALHADFDVPDVLWMRSTQTGHPRRGPAYDATVWSKLTLTHDHRRIREIAFAGVVRVA